MKGEKLGVRITDSTNVALYDSVSGVAFGPIFKDEDEAEDFLAWLTYRKQDDPRNMTPTKLHQAVWSFRGDAEAWGNDSTGDGLTLVEWLEREGR